MKCAPGSYLQHGSDSQDPSGSHPDLLPLVPPLHAEGPHQRLPRPQKPPSFAPEYPPALRSSCSTAPSRIADNIPRTSPNSIPTGSSHVLDTTNAVPWPDPRTSHPLKVCSNPYHDMMSPSSADPFSFGDFPVSGDVQMYSAQPEFAYMQAQNGNTSASRQPQISPAPNESRSVFNRLAQTPLQQQQASASTTQQHRSQAPACDPDVSQASNGTHDRPPGFASPGGVPDQQPAGSGDFPPGFKQSSQSSSASRSAPRSRMRSDHMAASAQPEQPSSQSAHSAQASPGHGGSPGGPPGFGGMPAYLAQRLSPSPAQKPAESPDQAGPHRPRATCSSPDLGNNPPAGQNSRQHLPAGAYDASSDDSPDEEPPGFARANNTAEQRGQAPATKPSGPENGRQPPRQTQREGSPRYGSGSTAPADNNGTNQVHTFFSNFLCILPACFT